jgi:hypothetical protein
MADRPRFSLSTDDGRTLALRRAGFPIMGALAILMGVLTIFSFAPVFGPVGLLFGVLAMFRGQVLLAIVAILLTLFGLATSPSFLAILAALGIAAVWL